MNLSERNNEERRWLGSSGLWRTAASMLILEVALSIWLIFSMDEFDGPAAIINIVACTLLMVGGTITFRHLYGSRRQRATVKYEHLLRAIDNSKGSTPMRTATTTAIDAVANRTHVTRTTASVILTVALFFALLLNLRWSHVAPQGLVILLVAAIVILNTSTLALDYRVARGLFGTNEHEAREIVRFVLENAVDNDFSGGLGARDLGFSENARTDLVAVWSGVRA